MQRYGFEGAGKKEFPVLTAALCGWCAVVFFAISTEKDPSLAAARKWGYVSDLDIFRGDTWGLITSAYVHVEPIHLIFNLYWLWILGGAFERALGPFRLLVFAIFAAFVSSGCQFLTGDSGIGMSGVGYALVGFGWIARTKYPEFRIVNERVIGLFVIWGLFCIVATYVGFLNVGNFAHAAGFFFGICVAALACLPRWRVASSVGVAAISALSVLSLVWNPLSKDWAYVKAEEARDKGDFRTAARFYERAIERGGEPEWTWTQVARLYGHLNDKERYRAALEKLKSINPQAANEIIKEYGTPQ